MRHPLTKARRTAAALVSAVAILLVTSAFAALVLSVHAAQVSSAEAAISRLRAEAAALAATHLTLWNLTQDEARKNDLARVIHQGDTSFEASPLFKVDGDLAGATFHVDLWPGQNCVRLKVTGQSAGVHFQRWAQMPAQLNPGTELLAGGNFEDRAKIYDLPIWLGVPSVGQWLAGWGITCIDNPRQSWVLGCWNITRDGNNHFAEELQASAILAQYASGRGVKGTLRLEFDYLRADGDLSVSVRGVKTLPGLALLLPGLPGYDQWADAGVVLYDSGNLPLTASWKHLSIDVPAGEGYAYYVVQFTAQAGFGIPASPRRAVDNVSLKGSR